MPTDKPRVAREARASAVLFEYLSDPTRLAILGLLASEGEMFVGQLCERSGCTQSAASNQLRLHRSSGFVETRREGPRVIYSFVSGFEGLTSRV